jgi:pyruvate dehydrogenase E1 component beta subunit
VAHEAVKAFGFGAEVVAMVCEELGGRMRPPVRVGAPFVPVPFAQEKQYLPAAAEVVQAVKRVMVS